MKATGSKLPFILMLLGALLAGNSCNLSDGWQFGGSPGKGTLTLILPGTGGEASRSLLSNDFTGALKYQVVIAGAEETMELELGEGGTTLLLKPGVWTISAEAYVPDTSSVKVGTGGATVVVAAGRNVSAKINMTVDPAYEATLLDVYIHNEAELRRIGAAVNGLAIDGSIRAFYLENDIVLTQPWTPIGGPGNPFRAKFDGQGHSVTVNSFSGAVKDAEDHFVYLGFFANVENAEIKNTTIVYKLAGAVDMRTGDTTMYANSCAGGIAGKANNAAFENLRVSGDFSAILDGGWVSMGGIVGDYNSGRTITGCSVAGYLEGISEESLDIGGIVGWVRNNSAGMSITRSSFVGVIESSAVVGCRAGGIVGFNDSEIEISACYAEEHIKAEGASSNVGGIAGSMSAGSIKTSYAVGIIEGVGTYPATGKAISGGIAGWVTGTAIENCYAWIRASSRAPGEEYAGGIAGRIGGTIAKCYAMGELASKGQAPTTYVGGIAGSESSGLAISGSMALASPLDGGPPASTTKKVYAIGSSASFNGNYARNDMTFANRSDAIAQGLNNKDGLPTPLADFTTQTPYETAGWDFTAGTGVWKFVGGHDYPALSWQTALPGAALANSGSGVVWP